MHKNITSQFILVIALLFQFYQAKAQLNKDLVNALPDTLKPKNIQIPTTTELAKILNNALYFDEKFNKDFNRAESDLSEKIKTETDQKQKINGYYALSIYNFNSLQNDSLAGVYANKLISLIGNDTNGYEKELFNTYLLKASLLIEDKAYEKAIDELNKAIVLSPKVKSKQVIVGSYKSLAFLNQTLHLYKASINNLLIADKISDTSSSMYKNYDFSYIPITISDNYIKLYFIENNKKYLDTAVVHLDKLRQKHDLKGRWLADWYVMRGYIFYATSQYDKALVYADSSLLVKFDQKDVNALLSKKLALKGLALVKTGQKQEGLKLLNSRGNLSENFFLTRTVYQELYKTNKELGNFKEATKNLEEYLAFVEKENVAHYRGIVFAVNQKYKAKEKENTITLLKKDYEKRKATNQLTIFIFIIIFGLLSILLFYQFRIHKIKTERNKKIYQHKISLLNDKIAQHDQLIKVEITKASLNERINIAQNLHDDLSGNLVALQFMITDLKTKASTAKEKEILSSLQEEVKVIYTETRNFTRLLTKEQIGPESFKYDIAIYLQKMIAYFNDLGIIKITSNYDQELIKNHFDHIISENIYLILKECLTNIIKHANAKNVFIGFDFHETYFNIKVTDDGKGYSKTHHLNGMGINNITARIQKLGGTINMESGNNGTQLIATIPLK